MKSLKRCLLEMNLGMLRGEGSFYKDFSLSLKKDFFLRGKWKIFRHGGTVLPGRNMSGCGLGDSRVPLIKKGNIGKVRT